MSALGKVKTVLNALIRRGYWYDTVFMPDTRKFNVYSTFNTRVVNLGSTSAVYAFDYNGLGVKGANWALRRNPLAGDLAVLKNYSSYLDEKKSTVIIPLCPFSALSGSYEPFEERYYSILYASSIPGYSYVHAVQAQDKVINPVMHYPWYAIFTDLWHMIAKGENSSLTEDKMEADAQNWVKNWLHEFSLKDFSTPLSLVNKYNIEEAVKNVGELIMYCRDRNAELVLVVPPMYHTLSGKFNEETQNKLFGDLEGLAKKHGIKFLNYMNNQEFSQNRTYFRNSYLMNKVGAKAFTKRILTDLNII